MKRPDPRIAELVAVDDDTFIDAVHKYLLGDRPPTPADHAVFRSDELVERTRKALTVLIQVTAAEARRVEKGSEEQEDALDDQALLVAERKDLGPIIGKLTERRKREDFVGLQRLVGIELAKRYPEEALEIKRELQRKRKEELAAEKAAQQEA